MKLQIQQLLDKEMDRRDFLKYLGSVGLTLIGVTGLIRAIFHHDTVITKNVSSMTNNGYGSSSYGGSDKLS